MTNDNEIGKFNACINLTLYKVNKDGAPKRLKGLTEQPVHQQAPITTTYYYYYY